MNETLPLIPIIDSIAPFAARYRAWLCDVWGVLHDGLAPFTEAADACIAFRRAGGAVVLISNSPRPAEGVARQLEEIGVPDTSYDAIVTSGDVTRALLSERAGARVFHLGPQRDKPTLAGLDLKPSAAGEAELVLCTGLFDDDSETPDDYAGLLSELAARKLPMICANPDIQVERGHKLVYCAGALARAYERLGGAVTYAGKPHPPIYGAARAALESVRAQGAKGDTAGILAIGDGLATDMAGALAQRLDAVFIASGLHLRHGGQGTPLDPHEVAGLFAGQDARPIAAMKRLKW